MKLPAISNLIYLSAVIAHVPLFIGYVRINAAKGHYQFFPILVAVALWLTFDRINFLNQKSSKDSGLWNWLSASNSLPVEKSANDVAGVLFAFSAVVLAITAVVQSSFLVIPSLMILAASWIISRYGIRGFKLALPAWLLLVLAIPIPFNLDMVLVNRMQFLASRLASMMLDSLGQIHFREGLTLVTAKQQFFTEEACSGIRSLFSSIATISVYGVFHRLSLGRHVFNWLQVVVWVIIGNAIRIAIVVFVAENWTQSIASGPPHEMLGIGVFAGIVLLALCTSMAIDRLRSKESDPFSESSASEMEIESHVVQKNVEAAVPQKWPSIAALGFFAMVLLFSARLAFIGNSMGSVEFGPQDVVSPERAILPASIDGWRVSNFEKKSRPGDSLRAPNSCIWTFTNEAGTENVIVSFDSPYSKFHDLTDCYTGLGWSVSSAYDLTVGGNKGDRFSSLEMTKRAKHGVVYFSAYDRQGTPVSRTEAVSKSGNARRNIFLFLGIGDNKNDSRLPITQIQLVHESGSKLSDKKKASLLNLFDQARSRLKASVYSSQGIGN